MTRIKRGDLYKCDEKHCKKIFLYSMNSIFVGTYIAKLENGTWYRNKKVMQIKDFCCHGCLVKCVKDIRIDVRFSGEKSLEID